MFDKKNVLAGKVTRTKELMDPRTNEIKETKETTETRKTRLLKTVEDS